MTEDTTLFPDLPAPERQPTMAEVLGTYVTITNPGNGSSWTGRVIAYHDDPGVVIETADGTHICLPQAFGIEQTPAPANPAAFPPPVSDFGLVELELMGHRYRAGHLSEVVIAGQPFLRLATKNGRQEYYRPDAVYCLTPVPEGAEPTAITGALGVWRDDRDDDDGPEGSAWDDDDKDPF